MKLIKTRITQSQIRTTPASQLVPKSFASRAEASLIKDILFITPQTQAQKKGRLNR